MANEPEWMNTLLDPASYPHPVTEVRLVQTHISWVFLAGERVYKIKKPVDFGFLDFTNLAKREHYCREELRLNRRLCPGIYLDVWPISRSGETFLLNGKGEPAEWCLVMKRMPETGMMPRIINDEALSTSEIDAIIDKLVPFYRAADAGAETSRFGETDIIRRNTEENFEQTEPFLGKILEREFYEDIRSYTRDFLKTNESLFSDRIAHGWIREGHGDLYSANICFDKERNDVYIFDCIEFNQRFRCGDVASDIAFLAMDLDYHGRPDLSAYFARSYAARSGDAQLLELMDFYKCYRAYVRGKIGCFTWAAQGVDEKTRNEAKDQAGRYFQLARKYSGRAVRPTLFVFFGLSGTGKSTIASAWAKRHALPVYNSDRVRKELAVIPATERHTEPFEKGIYGPELTDRTYKALARKAGRHLVRAESVIVDATFRDAAKRRMLLDLAFGAGARIRFILCECPEEIIRERLGKRAKSQKEVSDAGWEIYLNQKKRFASVKTLPRDNLTVLPSNRRLENILKDLDRILLQ